MIPDQPAEEIAATARASWRFLRTKHFILREGTQTILTDNKLLSRSSYRPLTGDTKRGSGMGPFSHDLTYTHFCRRAEIQGLL